MRPVRERSRYPTLMLGWMLAAFAASSSAAPLAEAAVQTQAVPPSKGKAVLYIENIPETHPQDQKALKARKARQFPAEALPPTVSEPPPLELKGVRG